MPATIGDFAITAVLGYAVVFFGLVLLMLVITVVGKIMTAKKATPVAAAPEAAPEAPAAPAPEAPGTAGKLTLVNVSDRDAAMIMAIVANKMGKPLNELRFKSIKEVQEDEV